MTSTEIVSITPELEVTISGAFNKVEELFTNENGLSAQVAIISDFARCAVNDPTTESGRKDIKLLAKNIAKARKKLDDEGKRLCDFLKERPKMVDAARRKMRQELEALEAEILAPITAIENRHKELEEISHTHDRLVNATSNEIISAIENIGCIAVTHDYWQESYQDAVDVVKKEVAILQDLLNQANVREAEALELENLRKQKEEAERIIREEQIRKQAEAEAQARMEAEKKMLEQQKAAAEERARIAEEKAKQVVAQPQQIAQPKKTTSEELKQAVAEMKEVLLTLTNGDADVARAIGIAIYKNQIPHVKFEI